MPDCDRCGAAFDDEDAYLMHLAKDHPDDLSEEERRRLLDGGEETSSRTRLLAAALVLGLVVGVGYLLLFVAGLAPTSAPAATTAAGGTAGGPAERAIDAAVEPGAVGSAHYHGRIAIYRQSGARVDLRRPEYQLRAERFHMEGGDGARWHAHATGVTLEFGLRSLGFDESDWVATRVDGRPVDPAEYVLQPGDRVDVTVE